MNWLEFIGVFFGILCVVLTVRQSVWCWPTGLIEVLVFIWVFYHARLYSNFILHIIYALLQIYGWWQWARVGKAGNQLQVITLSRNALIGWSAAGLAVAGIWGTAMAHFTDAAVPYPGAFLTVSSLIAQWLLTKKYLESWYFWIVVDVAAVPLFASRGLYLTAGLHAVCLSLAVTGYFAWKATMQQTGSPQHDGISCQGA
jgi:nicotinamide mononucleotide transporter